MPIHAYTGSLARPAPQYAEANGRGITRRRFDDERGHLVVMGETGGIDDAAQLVAEAGRPVLHTTCEVPGTNRSAVDALDGPLDVDRRRGAISDPVQQVAMGMPTTIRPAAFAVGQTSNSNTQGQRRPGRGPA